MYEVSQMLTKIMIIDGLGCFSPLSITNSWLSSVNWFGVFCLRFGSSMEQMPFLLEVLTVMPEEVSHFFLNYWWKGCDGRWAVIDFSTSFLSVALINHKCKILLYYLNMHFSLIRFCICKGSVFYLTFGWMLSILVKYFCLCKTGEQQVSSSRSQSSCRNIGWTDSSLPSSSSAFGRIYHFTFNLDCSY